MKPANQPRALLDQIAIWSAWTTTILCIILGVLCATQGRAGLQFTAAFFGFAGAVCPSIKVHWAVKLAVGGICLLILS